MSQRQRTGRGCSRVGCRSAATMTLTYIYSDSTAVIGPLATYSEPHAYDLCAFHGERLTVPHGWSVMKHEVTQVNQGPTHDDLMAIAHAVREAAAEPVEVEVEVTKNVGRRGHLRSVPTLS